MRLKSFLLALPLLILFPIAAHGEVTTVVISAAGDCTLGRDERNGYAGSFDWYYEQNGAAYFFGNVAEIFKNDDLTIVNLEGALTLSNEGEDKKYVFKGPPDYAEILRLGNIEAVTLANNHTYDYGRRGYADTKDALDEYGIKYFGNGDSLLYEVKGIFIGLLGYSGFGGASMNVMEAEIAGLRENGAALVIVSFHWGVEYDNYPSETQKRLARFAVDAGADLVLGHHPHVMQGIELYKGKFIVYSLANFSFGGNRNPSDKDTFIFKQTFTLTDGKPTQDINIDIIPCRVSSVASRNDFKPTPLFCAEGERVLNRLIEFSGPFYDLSGRRHFRSYLKAALREGYTFDDAKDVPPGKEIFPF